MDKTNVLKSLLVVISFPIGLIIVFITINYIFSGESLIKSEIGQNTNNQVVSKIDGKQNINITVKGGYFPRSITAESGIPTTLLFNTNKTYDCSLALVIPSLNITESLPTSGTRKIEIPAQGPGTKLTGLCSMGMYKFDINFL